MLISNERQKTSICVDNTMFVSDLENIYTKVCNFFFLEPGKSEAKQTTTKVTAQGR